MFDESGVRLMMPMYFCKVATCNIISQTDKVAVNPNSATFSKYAQTNIVGVINHLQVCYREYI